VSPEESRAWNESRGDPSSLLAPQIVITRESLFAAIEQVERLAAFIESKMDNFRIAVAPEEMPTGNQFLGSGACSPALGRQR
jgi:hypothetical protein